MRLSGRKVALTGASGGLGRAVMRFLEKEGAELCLIGRQDGNGASAGYIRADLETQAGVEEASHAIAEREIDILINLAGIQHFGPLESETPGHVLSTFMVDLVAPVLLARAVLPGMKARGRGQIVNIGSIFGSISYAHFVSYSSAKAGLRAFSEALRRELKDTPVAVTYIAPRAIATGLSRDRVIEFAKLSKMSLDDPDRVAARIVEAVIGRRKDVYLGLSENIFVRVNALLPRVVDAALAGNDRKAKQLFLSAPSTEISS